MLPDLSLPSLNDAGGSVLGQRDAYEFANKVYSDSEFDWILGTILGRNSRNSVASLIDGIDYDVSNTFTLSPFDLPNMGVSTIRNEDFYLALDYGPHGGKFSRQNQIYGISIYTCQLN